MINGALMRKPKYVVISLLAGTSLLLTGCFEDDDPKFIESLNSCIQQFNDKTGCELAQKEARESFNQLAPAFGSMNDCESEAGNGRCERNMDGVFVPVMAGFIMGRTSAENTYLVQPACRDRDNNVYSNGCTSYSGHGGGGAIHYVGKYNNGTVPMERSFKTSWSASKVALSSATASGNAKAAVIRGGFGSGINAHGSGGGE